MPEDDTAPPDLSGSSLVGKEIDDEWGALLGEPASKGSLTPSSSTSDVRPTPFVPLPPTVTPAAASSSSSASVSLTASTKPSLPVFEPPKASAVDLAGPSLDELVAMTTSSSASSSARLAALQQKQLTLLGVPAPAIAAQMDADNAPRRPIAGEPAPTVTSEADFTLPPISTPRLDGLHIEQHDRKPTMLVGFAAAAAVAILAIGMMQRNNSEASQVTKATQASSQTAVAASTTAQRPSEASPTTPPLSGAAPRVAPTTTAAPIVPLPTPGAAEPPAVANAPVAANASATTTSAAPSKDSVETSGKATDETENPAKSSDTTTASPLAQANAAFENGDAAAAYKLAAQSYDDKRDNEAVFVMTQAACQMDDGPKARIAYRKLVGGDVRAKAATACKQRGIDLLALAAEGGLTAIELYEQARAAADDNDWKNAFLLSKQSARVERRTESLQLMALSACKLGDEKNARWVLNMLKLRDRSSIIEACKDKGIALE